MSPKKPISTQVIVGNEGRIDFTPPGQQKKQMIVRLPDGPRLVELEPGQVLSTIHEIEHFNAPPNDAGQPDKPDKHFGLSDAAVSRMQALDPDFDKDLWLARRGRGQNPYIDPPQVQGGAAALDIAKRRKDNSR